MPLADSNIWLALALSKHELHSAARAWLGRRPTRQPALFCRSTQQSFLRLLTTTAVLAPYGIPALRNKDAWAVYENLLADERIAWVDEPHGLQAIWKTLASSSSASPKLWIDAYLAAFAISGKHQLVTADKAFKQFKNLDLLLLSKS